MLKGSIGEGLVKFGAWLRLPAHTYQRVHNVTLPTPTGSTQIDHVFVSRFGIFVVETKHMKGWIFGSANQAQWTQKLYKKSFKFQNPLRQNYKHVKVLEELLNVPPATINSVIVFTGDSKFKTSLPDNVTKSGGFIRYIESFREPVLSFEQVDDVLNTIQAIRFEPFLATSRQHIKNLKAAHSASSCEPSLEQGCPRCGSLMVLRAAKRGSSAGASFLGCSAYPKCTMTQEIGCNLDRKSKWLT